MVQNTSDFKSLTDISDVFTGNKGVQCHALFHGFLNIKSKITLANNQFVISNFVNVSGVTDKLNKLLGVKLEENKDYHNLSANISWFVYTKEEAQLIADQSWVKGNYLNAPVTVNVQDYKGKPELQLVINSPFVKQKDTDTNPNTNSQNTAKQTGSTNNNFDFDNGDTIDISDDDLPF